MPDLESSEKETDHLFPRNAGTEPRIGLSARTYGFLLHHQFLAFNIMEVAFISFAWFCFNHPVPIPHADYSNLSTMKSGLVAVFNIWHTIAAACGLHTCFETFSREWAARPERTDRVSTTSSGTIDRIIYYFKPRATGNFRGAFFLFLLLTLLRTTGSSVITAAGTTRIGFVNVSNVISPSNLTISALTYANGLRQANMIARLEQLEGVLTGYGIQPNRFIPLPSIETDYETLKLGYSTDVVSFEYDCYWRVPDTVVLNSTGIWATITVEKWTYLPEPESRKPAEDSMIIQLSPLSLPSNKNRGVSVFLFVGDYGIDVTRPNGTDISLPVLYKSLINLSDQPTVNFREMTNDTAVPRLATLLVCDPQLDFTSESVLLSPTADPNTPDLRVLPRFLEVPREKTGNVDPHTARLLFSTALSSASNPTFDYNSLAENNIGEDIFLSPWMLDNDNSTILQFTPHNLTTIEKRLEKYMLSAMKAFTRGFRNKRGNSRSYTLVPAIYDNDRLALVTSFEFVLGHTLLFIVTTWGLAGLRYLNRIKCHPMFNLENIEEELCNRILSDEVE